MAQFIESVGHLDDEDSTVSTPTWETVNSCKILSVEVLQLDSDHTKVYTPVTTEWYTELLPSPDI